MCCKRVPQSGVVGVKSWRSTFPICGSVAANSSTTLRQSAIRVPEDVSVVGIDDQPFLTFLSLTTVRLPVMEASKHAIDLLIKRINNPDTEASHILLPCPLIVRSTVGPTTLMEENPR